MGKQHLVLGASAFICFGIAMPGTAFGLSCIGNRFAAPNRDATDVPTNTLIWGFGEQTDERLMGPEGEVPVERYFLPIALGRGFGTALSILRPTTELAPRTRYWREYEYESSPGQIETVPSTSPVVPSSPVRV